VVGADATGAAMKSKKPASWRDGSLADLLNDAEGDLLAIEKAWVQLGGSRQHFTLVHAFRSKIAVVLEKGPVGFLPAPDGCQVVDDVNWLIDDSLINRYQKDIGPHSKALSYWCAQWSISHNIFESSPSFIIYPVVWSMAASKNKCRHLCWSSDNERVHLNVSRIGDCLYYLFVRDMGHPVVPLFELMILAIVRGYWPVGVDGEDPIVLRCNEDEILPRSARVKSKRKSM
jgi:hypothetical protein